MNSVSFYFRGITQTAFQEDRGTLEGLGLWGGGGAARGVVGGKGRSALREIMLVFCF